MLAKLIARRAARFDATRAALAAITVRPQGARPPLGR